MLAHRIATGVVLVSLVLVVLVADELWFAPTYPIWGLSTTVLMGLVALEMIDLLNSTSARPSGNTVFGGVLAIGLANWAPHLIGPWMADRRLPEGSTFDPMAPVLVLAWPLWAFVGVVMFAFVAQSAQFSKPGRTMATIAGTILATAYVGLLGSFLVQLRWADGPHRGLVPLAALLASAKGADIGAYTFGRLAGRRKLWPSLSPNKTVEGAFGGLVLGTLAAFLVFGAARLAHQPVPPCWVVLGFGLVVAASAQLGDLMESMIKRDCERKDSSRSLPGFGGLLDVVDSLLFAGPVAYGYWLLLGV